MTLPPHSILEAVARLALLHIGWLQRSDVCTWSTDAIAAALLERLRGAGLATQSGNGLHTAYVGNKGGWPTTRVNQEPVTPGARGSLVLTSTTPTSGGSRADGAQRQRRQRHLLRGLEPHRLSHSGHQRRQLAQVAAQQRSCSRRKQTAARRNARHRYGYRARRSCVR